MIVTRVRCDAHDSSDNSVSGHHSCTDTGAGCTGPNPTPSHTEPSPSTGTGNNTDPRYNTEELTLRLILCQNQI